KLGKIAIGAGKKAPFSVSVPPTASFDCLLPVPRAIWRCASRSEGRSCPKITRNRGKGRINFEPGGMPMSIFGNIMSAIFRHSSTASAAPTASAAQPAPQSAPAPPAPASLASQVDIGAIMDDLAAKAPQQLNWRTSIVDLMKLLNLDS